MRNKVHSPFFSIEAFRECARGQSDRNKILVFRIFESIFFGIDFAIRQCEQTKINFHLKMSITDLHLFNVSFLSNSKYYIVSFAIKYYSSLIRKLYSVVRHRC